MDKDLSLYHSNLEVGWDGEGGWCDGLVAKVFAHVVLFHIIEALLPIWFHGFPSKAVEDVMAQDFGTLCSHGRPSGGS